MLQKFAELDNLELLKSQNFLCSLMGAVIGRLVNLILLHVRHFAPSLSLKIGSMALKWQLSR